MSVANPTFSDGDAHDFLGEIRKGIGLVAIPVGRVGYVGVTYLPPPERALGPIYLGSLSRQWT